MIGAGISHGDLLVVDRSLNAVHGDICDCGGRGRIYREGAANASASSAHPHNPDYAPVVFAAEDELEIFGVVTFTLKANRHVHR